MEESVIIDKIQNENKSWFSFVKKWAILGSLVFILNSLVNHLIKDSMEPTTFKLVSSLITYPIIVILIILCLKDYKKSNEGYMSFGEGFKLGFVTFLIISFVTTIYAYFYFTYIIDFNTFQAEQIQETINKLKSKGMDEKQINETINLTKKFLSPGALLATSFVGFLLISVIFNLIVSAIMSKSRPHFS